MTYGYESWSEVKQHAIDLALLTGLFVCAGIIAIREPRTARRWVEDLEGIWCWIVGGV